jgi:N-methylhydantoinase A
VWVAMADFTALDTLFMAMVSECSERMPDSIDPSELSYERAADMRYVGQGYNVAIPLPDAPLSGVSAVDVRGWFDETYRKLYGRTYDDLELEFINLRLTATAPMGNVSLTTESGDGQAEPVGKRQAYCPAVDGFVAHAIYERADLSPGFECAGPVIVQENESTTIIGSDGNLSVDAQGSLLVSLARRGSMR